MERPEFDRLIVANLPRIENAAKKYAKKYRQLHEWEDLLQTALLKMLRFADQYNIDKGDLLPWACVVIINTLKTHLTQSIAEPRMEEIDATIPNISDSSPDEDLQASLILSTLNVETRLYIEGYNYLEIAGRCGFRSKGTAKSRIDQCAADLRRTLGLTRAQEKRTKRYVKSSG